MPQRHPARVYRQRRLMALLAVFGILALAVTTVTVLSTQQSMAYERKPKAPVGPTGPGTQGGDGTHPDRYSLALDPELPQPVLKQLTYARDNWNSTANNVFGVLDDNDCVNFTSQTLLERGWEIDAEWSHTSNGDPTQSSKAWRSSTILMNYLSEHPERAVALTDDQRELVKPGDIVQFDWDASGDRDHTAVVTAVRKVGKQINIYYAGHTENTWDRSVDHHPSWPETKIYYWSVVDEQPAMTPVKSN